VTTNPAAEWITGEVTEALPWKEAQRDLLRDSDGAFGAKYTRRIRAIKLLVTGVAGLDRSLHRRVLCSVKSVEPDATSMKDLDEALTEINAIRSQLARATEFRGYGPVTVAATGLLAVIAAWIQAVTFPSAAHDITAFIAIWTVTAAIATAVIGLETVIRSRTIHSGLAQEMIFCAVEQLVPSCVAGILIAGVLIRVAPDSHWMIPGLWEILFSLGVFASARFLPQGVIAVAGWYLVAGLLCLAWSAHTRSLSPWTMGLPFGVGQLLAASVLWWSSEIHDVSNQES